MISASRPFYKKNQHYVLSLLEENLELEAIRLKINFITIYRYLHPSKKQSVALHLRAE